MIAMYDIGIIGGGPAGATLARLVCSGRRVLLISNGRQKCCGGILAPEAQKLLAQLDLALPKSVLADPQPFAVTIIDAQSNLIKHYPRQYINVNRNKFDQWLLSLLPASIDFRQNAIYHKAELSNNAENITQDNYIDIHFSENGKHQTAKVKWLVGADGGASSVRNHFFKTSAKLKKYIAFQDWFDDNNVKIEPPTNMQYINFHNNYVGIFDEKITDFYCWTIPKDGQLLIGGAIPITNNARNNFEKLKSYLDSIGLKTNQIKKKELALITRPMSTSAINLGKNQILLAGEAAGLISPTSAEGVSFALASATALANAFNSNKNVLLEYKKNTKNIIANIKLKYLKSPAMFNPHIRKFIMKSGLTALKK
ncbi:MAG: FAD-binding protein [Planctomycetaceae bacterium]|jgi:flavin-dependent dehydrogenase|nr:FAD-binding protein [Planctomycetaceae bacterium]